MKVVILAGGFGSRISEETNLKPKPMIDVGGKPMLWHIMKMYSHYDFNDFVICLGYKGYMIKEYFANYYLHQSDITLNLCDNSIEYHKSKAEPWKITLVDTGLNTMTGGRIKRIQKYIGNETFMLTYGDGVSDINISDLVQFHKDHGKKATLTAIQPSGKFGALNILDNGIIETFQEKIKGDGAWINGGFFVLEPEIFDYIANDPNDPNNPNDVWERKPLEILAKEGNLVSYKHDGFWRCMDTLRDKKELDEMWFSGRPKWKIWG